MALTQTEFDRLKRLGSFGAQMLMEPTFRELLAELKNQAIRGWSDAPTPERREEFWRDLQAVGRLENLMKTLGQEYRVEVQKIEGAVRREKNMQDYLEASRG
jgi:hypothetical protein